MLEQSALSAGASLRGVQHPNGFIKIQLFSRRDLGAVRLHVWPPLSDEGHLHNHRWDFSSVILSGCLHTEEFVVADGTRLVAHRCKSTPTGYSFESMGPRNVVSVAETQVRTGEAYFQDHASFHRARALRDGCVSLVVCGPAFNDSSTVLVSTNDTPASERFRELESHEIQVYVGQAMEMLNVSI